MEGFSSSLFLFFALLLLLLLLLLLVLLVLPLLLFSLLPGLAASKFSVSTSLLFTAAPELC